MTHGTTRVNLEDVMLSEISQSQKRQVLQNSIYMRYLRVVKSIETGSRRVVARDWGEELKRRGCCMGIEFQFGKMTKLWIWMVVILANGVNVLEPQNSTL